MAVGEWSPVAAGAPDRAELQAAAALWRERGEAAVADVAEQATLRGVMRLPAEELELVAGELENEALDALIRLFTLIESHPGWEAAERSPVIPLFRMLRGRVGREATEELATWVKARTDNRFLPHGSLQDRLRG
ncbi:MAG: hypothetical protein U5R48_11100 [Gammaproteobacteria bacterium]|nr:hypothetical protein [Gammaproteobacteria bacterium]